MQTNSRSLEEAADELGRLDAIAGIAPPAYTKVLRSYALVELANLGRPEPASRPGRLDAVIAAEGDPLHDVELPKSILHWRDLLSGEERRVRSGTALTSQRFAIVAPTLATYADRARLEAIWRETGNTRPVLARALDAAAWSPDRALGEATAALLLVSGGRADRLRLLPFADLDDAAAADAFAAWRAGDEQPWHHLGLGAAARRARAVRRAVEQAWQGATEAEAPLDALGRGAISARRVLAHLLEAFVTTVPALADSLALSRPAAADAIERLVSVGLAREVTGRARDRVFAYAPACDVTAVLASPVDARVAQVDATAAPAGS